MSEIPWGVRLTVKHQDFWPMSYNPFCCFWHPSMGEMKWPPVPQYEAPVQNSNGDILLRKKPLPDGADRLSGIEFKCQCGHWKHEHKQRFDEWTFIDGCKECPCEKFAEPISDSESK